MEALLYQFLMNSSIFMSLFILAAGLYALGKGADILVDNAVSLSLKWKIPKMLIGATIVSLGTTLPEASVSIFAAIKGNTVLVLGTAIGSIIANTSLIVGLTALLRTFPVDKMLIHRQGTIQIGSALLLACVSLPFFSPGCEGKIYQWMGWIFTILLVRYLYFSFCQAKQSAAGQEHSAPPSIPNQPVIVLLTFLAFGIVIIIGSSKILIPTVEVAALKAGIPQSVIATTLIAFGTSVPELITALTAVKKGHGELAAGNIIGADILNVLFVVGCSAAVTPFGITVPVSFFYLQIPAMILVSLIFRVSASRKSAVISRTYGVILLAVYIVYIILNFTLQHNQ